MADGRRLTRSTTNKVIAGVAGGMGDYFNIDPVILRVIWLVLVLGAGTGVLLYLICWLIIPEETAV